MRVRVYACIRAREHHDASMHFYFFFFFFLKVVTYFYYQGYYSMLQRVTLIASLQITLVFFHICSIHTQTYKFLELFNTVVPEEILLLMKTFRVTNCVI